MARVKRGTTKNKTRRNILKQVKGYRHDGSKKEAAANTMIMHAGANAFAHRRDKKGDFRRLWNVKINAGLREQGTTYSKFIGAMKKKSIEVDRKILAILAHENPEVFKRLVEVVGK